MRAVATGRTMRLVTIKAPIILTDKAIVIAARRVKTASIFWTLTPDSLAVFGSMAMAKRAEYLVTERIITRINTIEVFIISAVVTDEIEPKR